MGDEEPVVFWVHRTSGDKLWDEPPAADLAQYETWEFNPATGEVNQQPEPGSPQKPEPGSGLKLGAELPPS